MVAIRETAVTDIISRRAMLMAVLAVCSISFAPGPAYVPGAHQLVRPGSESHRADGFRGPRMAAPQRPAHQDPFADLLLG
jgi:hypothetical protein